MSFDSDPYTAGVEATKAAIAQARAAPDFAFCFCSDKKYSSEIDLRELIRAVHKTLTDVNPNCKWIGCTTPFIGGCKVFVIKSDSLHASVGIGSAVNKDPFFAGERAASLALSELKLDKYVLEHLASLALQKYKPEKLIDIQPYFIAILMPDKTNRKELIKGVCNIVGPYTQIFTGTGQTMSNGVLFKDTAVLFAGAFDVGDECYRLQYEWLSSIFGECGFVQS